MKKELKTKLTQERIIDAALIEFSQKGYKAFGINELCKNHKISKGVLYHNFAGKTELYLACVRESFHKAVSMIRGESGEVPSLADYVERRHRFSKDFPHHSHIFFEAWLMTPAEIAEEVAKEKAVFEDLNRQVSEKLLAESTLKDHISQEQALDYLSFIQQLFRSYYLAVNGSQGTGSLASQYENDLQKVLHLMIYGIFKDGD
ncbi:TetR/AcrR family transcriptional regulator [Streptococcus ferus]|uniref:Intercellular adhesion protein R n=1 Tax=Streptococcus ferus TaxID=1345 RepID=A0A2X3VQN6_9STRE|nr:TetR/AcrR family transcriptional regulator [Streptococcus ferus]SQF40035.1 Intercellular adhesion protein R [Streptococcus ferus]